MKTVFTADFLFCRGDTDLNDRSMNMCEGPILKKVIIYTLPIIATGLLQLLFNAADLVVVGRCCGKLSIAAVGSTGPLINLIVNLFMGLSVGSGVSVAHALGAKDDAEVHKTVHTSIPVSLVCGVVLTLVGVFGADTFLKMMSSPDDVIGLSSVYLKIYFLGITSNLVYNFGAAILRAAGDTRSPLLFLTAAGVINVILNVFFVMAFRMNVAGVALATTLSQTLAAALVLRALVKRTDACRLEFKKLRFHKLQMLKILRIGIPAGIQSSLFAVSNVIIQSSVNSFGSVVVSGNAAAQNIEGFVWITMNSFSQTALNFTGQNAGAKRYDRVLRVLWACLGCVTVCGVLFGFSVHLLDYPLLHIYITDSEAAIAYGAVRIAYICLPYFLCGMMDVTTGAIRGLGSSIIPMLITVIGVCVMRVAWIYTVFQIPQYHTPESLYISYPISWLVTFLAQLITYFIVYRKRTRV